MFIRSGEQDTISMIKKILRFFRSLKTITFLTDIFLFLVTAPVLIIVALSVEKSDLFEEKTNEVTQYCEELARKIRSNAYLANSQEDTAITREMSIVADRYAGRIVIINSNLRCISDTYNIDAGKTFISSEVIQTLKNNPNVYRDDKNMKLEVYYPIQIFHSPIHQ